MTESYIKKSIETKDKCHEQVYDTLADEYKARALDLLKIWNLLPIAKRLKVLSPWDKALELWVWWWVMNRHLTDVWFKTTWIYLVEKPKYFQKSGFWFYFTFKIVSFNDVLFGFKFCWHPTFQQFSTYYFL